MCTTCGCSTSAKVSITKLKNPSSLQFHREGAVGAGLLSIHHHHPHGDDSGKLPTALRHERQPETLRLEEKVLAKNDEIARRNRMLFEEKGILALNLMSSPGAGKTTLLERTIRALRDEYAFQVVEGDQETTKDAERIRATGCQVVQINTGSGCHLEADMVARGMQKLTLSANSFVMIENVGNLVCPALFDLGERAKVVISSVTEGEDKPLKYPYMFRESSLMILNKVDLLPYVSFDVARCVEYARSVNPKIQILQLSATRGDGLESWFSWLRQQAAQVRGNLNVGSSVGKDQAWLATQT